MSTTYLLLSLVVVVGWVAAAAGGSPAIVLTGIILVGAFFLPGPLWLRPVTAGFFAVEIMWVDGFLAMSHLRDGNPFFGQDSVFGSAWDLTVFIVVPLTIYSLIFYASMHSADMRRALRTTAS
jgi:hypothetical protein